MNIFLYLQTCNSLLFKKEYFKHWPRLKTVHNLDWQKKNDQCYPRISKYKSIPTLIWIEMNFFGSLVTTRLMIFAFALDRSHPRLLLSPGKNSTFFLFSSSRTKFGQRLPILSPRNTQFLIYDIHQSNLTRSSKPNQSKDPFFSKIIKITKIIYKI